jgi:phosphohistidine swiveling domain-containing protein
VQPVSLAIAVRTTPESQIVLEKLRKSAGVVGPLITGLSGEAAVIAFGRSIDVVIDHAERVSLLPGAILTRNLWRTQRLPKSMHGEERDRQQGPPPLAV